MSVRTALANTCAVIEAVVPDTVWDDTLGFTQLRVTQSSDGSDSARTRQFTWQLNGDFDWQGDQLAAPWSSALMITINVELTYATGFDGHELQVVIAEDAIAIAKALLEPSAYESNTTGIWRRTTGPFTVDLGTDANDTTTVTLPVSIQFNAE